MATLETPRKSDSLTPPAVEDSLRDFWTTHEERDVDRLPETVRAVPPFGIERAYAARESLDGHIASRAVREAPPEQRKQLVSMMLSASLDLRAREARTFATAVFEAARLDELTPAAIVRGAEAAARDGRIDLLARTRRGPFDTVSRAAAMLELVAARLERQGEPEAARRLRRVR